jgi:hypothetical protein
MDCYCDGEAARCSAILLIWDVLNFLVPDVNNENGMFLMGELR